MRKNYEKPYLEAVKFESNDVIMTSGAEFDVSDFFGGAL